MSRILATVVSLALLAIPVACSADERERSRSAPIPTIQTASLAVRLSTPIGEPTATRQPAATAPAATKVQPTPTLDRIDAKIQKEKDRSAFLVYGQQIWDIGMRSTRAHTAMVDQMNRRGIGTSEVLALVRRNNATQSQLLSDAVSVSTPPKGADLSEALQRMISARQQFCEKTMKALESGDRSQVVPVQEAAIAAVQTAKQYDLLLAARFVEFDVQPWKDYGGN